ncbi:MAG: tRNA lysidine(34) synthetase TilS, partial [Pseudomonadota bacterium]
MAVALSGGADSFALLHALHTDGVPVVALTVDHGLRPEAAEEAARVAAWCSDRGIAHKTLVWAEKPEGNLQANARTARYRLLCEACNRLGIENLVTGHTADDQAETVFMRLRRGSGRGLAGMPEKRLIAGGAGEPVTLHRPLLGVRRAETQAYAKAHSLPVSHDPSNEDDRFERVRVRALLAALEQQDLLTVEALCKTSKRMLATNDLIFDHWFDGEWLGLAFCPDVEGPYEGPDGVFLLRGSLDWKEIVSRAIFAVSGSDDRGENESVSDVSEYRNKGRLTVQGTIIKPEHMEHGKLWPLIFREPATLLGRADGTGGALIQSRSARVKNASMTGVSL